MLHGGGDDDSSWSSIGRAVSPVGGLFYALFLYRFTPGLNHPDSTDSHQGAAIEDQVGQFRLPHGLRKSSQLFHVGSLRHFSCKI